MADLCTMEVRAVRGRTVESVHRVHAVVAGPSGVIVHRWGDAAKLTLLRSAAKPFQALPLISEGAADHFGFSEEEIALCCGSHNAEEAHLRVARSMLRKAGLTEDLLACGPHRPLWRGRADELARNGTRLNSIMNNCSGKHIGMLALASFHGWPLKGYERLDHPVQRRVCAQVAYWTGAEPEEVCIGVDGCGVPCFALSLSDLARGVARLAAAAREESPARRVIRAMTRHPLYGPPEASAFVRVSWRWPGAPSLRRSGRRGVYIAGHAERGLGVALKVEDGAWRAAPPALLTVLARAGLLPAGANEALASYARPPVGQHSGRRGGLPDRQPVNRGFRCSSIP